MALQIIFSILQIACIVSLVILWRMWIKKKLASSFLIEDEDRLLFPFRYLSWIIGGVVLVTALAQTHFLWVSIKETGDNSKIKALYTKVEEQGHSIDETKRIVEKLGRDVELNFKALKVFGKDQLTQMRTNKLTSDLRLRHNEPVQKETAPPKPNAIKSASLQNAFAQEAKASSASAAVPESSKNNDHAAESSSMRLTRKAKAIADNLRVRKQPNEDAQIVDKLMSGQIIKVTEKKVAGDRIWFRIITPSGKAGWVEYNYVKLEGSV
jgi:hypothetical protein